MKKFPFIAALAMGLALVACSPKEAADETNADAAAPQAAEAPAAEKTLKDYTPSKAQIDSVSYLVGINFGSFIRGYNFGDLNFAQIKKGMLDFINAKGSQNDPEFVNQFKVNPEAMNDLFSAYLEKRQMCLSLENKEKAEKFFASNKNKEGVATTASGLQYKIIEAGNTDKKPGLLDTVKVYYTGTLLNGNVFDACKEEDANPATFTLNSVIKGWQEGMQLVGEGGKIRLWVPSELGYGERGTQGIEPNSALCFDVTLLEVAKYVEPVAE